MRQWAWFVCALAATITYCASALVLPDTWASLLKLSPLLLLMVVAIARIRMIEESKGTKTS